MKRVRAADKGLLEDRVFRQSLGQCHCVIRVTDDTDDTDDTDWSPLTQIGSPLTHFGLIFTPCVPIEDQLLSL